MFTRKTMLGCAAVLLALLVLLPSVRSADAQEDVKAKIAPELAIQLTAATPNEYVTAIVRLSGRPNLRMLQGDRPAVFSEMRASHARAQSPLIQSLARPEVKNKVAQIRQFWIDNIVLVRATPDVIAEIASRPDVIEVFENFTVTAPPRPEGPNRPNLGLGENQLWDSITKIGAKQVWTTYGFNGAGVRIGGLDTGVDISHPDISGKMVTNVPGDPTYPGGWAEFDSNGNIIVGSIPHDSAEHGTHTSGTMIGGNASGWDIGVAPGAQLMHGLVIPGGSGSFGQVAAGMEWIIDPDNNPLTDDGADVVNMSLGATGTYSAMIAPTDNMVAANVFPSFAIGNSGPSPNTTSSPGNVPSAFGVGMTDSMDVIASLSSRGPVTWNEPPYIGTWIKPDISAPGVKIYSSLPGGIWAWTDAGGEWSGTSMATPHVSGTVALMRQANPSLDVAALKQLLAQTAIDLGDPGMDNNYGYGRVNCFAAVTAALAGVGTLNGTVYSSGGGTVENAKALVLDTGQRVYTDEFGFYTMQLVAGDHTVEVSRFGYETETVTVTVVADAVTTQDVTLTQLPSGAIAGFVTDGDTGNGVAADITVKLAGEAVVWTATDPATGEYAVSLPVGVYDLVFSPVFPYPVTARNGIAVLEGATTTLDVALESATVLIVDDDAGAGYQTYIQNAVLASGRSFITVTTPPTAAEMAAFETVIWFTGNDYSTTLTAADEAELAAYLDGGGRLFITGQDIGYDIRTEAFYADYLHATYVQDDVGLGAVIGESGSPVGSGFAFDIMGGTGANNQGYPSEIDPIAPAIPAFLYNSLVPMGGVTGNSLEKSQAGSNVITSSGTAGLSVDTGTYKLVYFAFGFEAIADDATRNALMARILDWLLGYPEIAHTPIGDTEDTENPYHVTAVITPGYFALDPATFAVVYDVGAGAVSVPMTATGAPDEYAGDIPAQPVDTEVYYYITASDVEGHTSTDPLGAPLNTHLFRVGWDQEYPAVAHTKHYNTNDLVGPYHIYADAADNLGIESVYLLYSKNGGLFHRLRMEEVEAGRYHGAIPGPSDVGDVYSYHILVMDESYHGNVVRMPATGEYSFEIVEYFLWDFEPDDGMFVVDGDVWEWGTPTSGPGGAHSGANVWATVLAGTYPLSANAKLDIPPITLSASKPYAMLGIWHWYEMEGDYTRYDGGNVKVSTDAGATWTVVTPMGGYDGTASTANKGIPGEPCFSGYKNMFWQQELFDLSPYAGQTVTVRFHFGSDPSVAKAGWYIDDVMLRSTDVDDIPPIISNTVVPASTFDTAGPYAVTTNVVDFLGSVAGVSLFYSVDDGASWTETAMTAGTGGAYSASIPGQPSGSRIRFYIAAVDDSANESVDPAGAPGASYAFAILPSAPILVMQGTSSSTTLEMFRAALEANGHEADYWYRYSQGWLDLSKLSLYKIIVLDESGGLTTQQMTDLAAWLNGGTQAAKRRLFLLGRDLGFNSTTRPWLEQYMRAAYVKDDPAWRELTGYPGEFIGAEEVFVISGSYPDELQRSDTYPGGDIVYQFTGTGTAATREELADEYRKDEKEWDGVVPHDPGSLDAAAGIKYNGEKYRSIYFSFNLYYVLEPERRAGIMDRAIRWLGMPDIAHMPLSDTEDTLSAYSIVAGVYSETLDPSRVNLTYDVGMGDVTVQMLPTANPDEYAADVPPQKWGTTVTYYISAANTDGNTSYHPEGAPTLRHSFAVTADNQPPEIVHVPLSNTADAIGPYVVEATITDNVGVDPAGVTLTYNKNGGSNTTVNMVNVGGDLYQGEIPGPAVLGDVFSYYIRARDVAAIPNYARDPLAGYHSFEIVDYYAWDFEATSGGFAATGPDWEWGDPTTGPMDAHSGVNVWATKLAGDYSYSSNSKLETPVIVVPSSSTYAALSFWQWYYNETTYDGGNVKISTDGGSTWTILTPDIGYTGTASTANAGIPGEPCFTGYTKNFWHQATFDLTPYKGMPVMIRWHFGSDGSVNKVGWYIDDVRIEGAEDTAPPSFVLTTVPPSTFDEVGPYTVTTTVVDALSGVASVTLYYSTDGGGSWTTVAMGPTGTPDQYSGDIPGQSSGTRIKLYVAATDNASNAATDPATAPAVTYEFGIMPSGDYLVILGGGAHPTPEMFQLAFAAIGRTADIWDWDDLGNPTLAILQAYTGIIIDESWYFDTPQMTLLQSFLDADVGSLNQIFFMGRDLSYGSTARSFMEQYTGSAYVKDSPAWYQLTSTPGDPIGNDETFVISGSYPDELKLSTTWTGASIVYKYSGLGSSLGNFDTEAEWEEFYQKEGKEWDPRLLPMTPSGPDSAAAVRFVGPYHAAVYFAFDFNYITEDWRRAAILDRALSWLGTASGVIGADVAGRSLETAPEVPDKLALYRNYPNPFNPVTTIAFGVPADYKGSVELRIYNVKGELVKTVFEGTKAPGVHTFVWDGTNEGKRQVSSGIYFCRFTAGDVKITRKMVLLR